MSDGFELIRAQIREDPIRRAAHLAEENRELRYALSLPCREVSFVGSSPAACDVRLAIDDAARGNGTVLITGERGVGKCLAARSIHDRSPRRDGLFIAMNCATAPRDLLDAELFGRPDGATRLGRLDLARGGTLFLDELPELPVELQSKLLWFLKSRPWRAQAGPASHGLGVRMIASARTDLATLVQERRFSRDLAFLLSRTTIPIPPLRERRDDILLLAAHLIVRLDPRESERRYVFDPDARKALVRYRWPENVRELEAVLQRAIASSVDRLITCADLPWYVADERPGASADGIRLSGVPLREIERLAIAQTLEACEGNRAEAARRLGISKKGIYIKIKKLQLPPATLPATHTSK